MAKDLAIEPEALRFGASQEEHLVKTLDSMDTHTVLHPISAVADVTLDADAKIGGYRLTRWALAQLCHTTCQGLYGFLNEYAGINRSLEEAREDYSYEEAIDILNRVLHRRFDNRLCGHAFLRNTEAKTLDGILGSKYRWLSNLELYKRTKEAMTQLDPAPNFLEAVLNGRWLSLRFVESPPYTSIDNGDGQDHFHRGYHFSNNEVGQASVRAAGLLYRRSGKTTALAPAVINDRVRHTGSSFGDKLDEQLKGVFGRFKDKEFYRARLFHLTTVSLGLALPTQKDIEHRCDELVDKLGRKVAPGAAKKALTNVIYQGSYDSTPAEPTGFCPVDRTAYDLFNSLGREAKKLPINQREQMEQAAHAIMMGKLNLE